MYKRQLHDSLGQYLAGVKMNLDLFLRAQPSGDELLTNAAKLLDQSIAETRTISYLLLSLIHIYEDRPSSDVDTRDADDLNERKAG